MRPDDLTATLTSIIPTKRAVMLWGPPGVGKSSIVHQAVNSLNLDIIDVRAVLLDPCEIRGLPTVANGKATWCPPTFWPLKGEGRKPGVIFLDELPNAAPSVQSALLQGVLDFKIGEVEIDPNWTWVCAGNRMEDRAGSHRMISSLMNRLIHVDLEVSAEDWNEWALTSGVTPEVRSFIKFRPNLLFNFEPSANPRAFPTPRSWSMVSDVLKATPKNLVQRVVAGCVGEGAAAEFTGYLNFYQNLPDIDQVLANPTTTSIPKQPEVLYALSGALVDRVRNDPAKIDNFVAYVTRLPDEYGMLNLRDILAVNRKWVTNPAIGRWVSDARKKGMFVSSI